MNTMQAEQWRALGVADLAARDEILPRPLLDAYYAASDPIVNIAFGEAVLWVARHMATGQDVSVEWLRDQAFSTFLMVATEAGAGDFPCCSMGGHE